MSNISLTVVRQDPSALYVGGVSNMHYSHNADNASALVEVWGFTHDGREYNANLIRPWSVPATAQLMLGSVASLQGQWIWAYRDDARVRNGFIGRVYLRELSVGWSVVFLAGGKSSEVQYVLSLSELLGSSPPVMSARQSGLLKREAADVFGASAWLSDAEIDAVDHTYVLTDRMNTDTGRKELVKVTRISDGRLVEYRINFLASDGSLTKTDHLGPVMRPEAQMSFGRVPVAPAGDGIKTSQINGCSKVSDGSKDSNRHKKGKKGKNK